MVYSVVGVCRYDEPSTEAFIPLKFTMFFPKAELNFKANLVFSIHYNFKTDTTIDEEEFRQLLTDETLGFQCGMVK